MNMLVNVLVLIIFPAMMIAAASSDLLSMRISNRLVLALTLGFVILAFFIGMSLTQFAVHLGVAALVLVVAFGFFALGWVGGGDAKLAAATALWFGSAATLPYLAYAALCGGALTILVLLIRRLRLPPSVKRIKWIERLHTISGIPYGIALAAAGLLVYPQSIVFAHFAG